MNPAVVLDDVLARSDIWRGDRFASAEIPSVSSGFAPLDAELPGGGWPRGALTEILSDGVGLGECSLLLPALIRTQNEGRWSILVAPPQPIHGPAWAAAGIDLTRLIVVAATQQRDVLWTTEQSLASGSLGMVLSWVKQTDNRQVKRLQVAVAGSGALAFLFRPARVKAESSAASLRLLLRVGSRGKLGVKLLKRRGPPCHRTLYLDVPRPVKWREEHDNAHESALARAPSSLSTARSRRPSVLA
jgi:cell division inhibitor SulA/protein ImuA